MVHNVRATIGHGLLQDQQSVISTSYFRSKNRNTNTSTHIDIHKHEQRHTHTHSRTCYFTFNKRHGYFSFNNFRPAVRRLINLYYNVCARAYRIVYRGITSEPETRCTCFAFCWYIMCVYILYCTLYDIILFSFVSGPNKRDTRIRCRRRSSSNTTEAMRKVAHTHINILIRSNDEYYKKNAYILFFAA